MTPTTVEALIVAAAANAGFMAEQAVARSRDHLSRRAAELRELLNPGEGYVVNTLFLDPYLWGLQIGKDRLVQKLKAEGHPIQGVTITAGIPPLEEAVSLLEEFRSLGMDVNSLKVGNDDQIRQALAIADADETGFILQVEGGKGRVTTAMMASRKCCSLGTTASDGVDTSSSLSAEASGLKSASWNYSPDSGAFGMDERPCL